MELDRCRSRSSACRGPARPPSSPPSAAIRPRAATPRAERPRTSASSRSPMSGSMPWPRSSTRRNRSTPTSPTSTSPSRPAPLGPGPSIPTCWAGFGTSDALLHVARAFESPAAERTADPWRDVEELDLEYVVADLDVVTPPARAAADLGPARDRCRARAERPRGGAPRPPGAGARGGPTAPRAGLDR